MIQQNELSHTWSPLLHPRPKGRGFIAGDLIKFKVYYTHADFNSCTFNDTSVAEPPSA